MNHPFRGVGLLNLESLVIPELTIAAGHRVTSALQIFKNMTLSGFNETKCAKVEFNFDKNTLKLDCIVPHFRLDFHYELHGQIFLVSVYGNGTGWAVLQDSHFEVSYQLGEYENKGKTYFNIINQQLSVQPRSIDFDLKNLFDGDEEAADRFKKMLKENALEVYGDVKSGYDEAFGIIFATIFDRLLTKVPVSKLFG
ncbi:circadian clock-controlled protein daywake-like [Zophobas morio]|uniref:circadian clock-controlled protein daywake-like n=1 Tax=Zophobas morio TaxID=2755281 RepID=UPI003083E604